MCQRIFKLAVNTITIQIYCYIWKFSYFVMSWVWALSIYCTGQHISIKLLQMICIVPLGIKRVFHDTGMHCLLPAKRTQLNYSGEYLYGGKKLWYSYSMFEFDESECLDVDRVSLAIRAANSWYFRFSVICSLSCLMRSSVNRNKRQIEILENIIDAGREKKIHEIRLVI